VFGDNYNVNEIINIYIIEFPDIFHIYTSKLVIDNYNVNEIINIFNGFPDISLIFPRYFTYRHRGNQEINTTLPK